MKMKYLTQIYQIKTIFVFILKQKKILPYNEKCTQHNFQPDNRRNTLDKPACLAERRNSTQKAKANILVFLATSF